MSKVGAGTAWVLVLGGTTIPNRRPRDEQKTRTAR